MPSHVDLTCSGISDGMFCIRWIEYHWWYVLSHRLSTLESTQLVNISFGFFSLFFPTIYVNFKTAGLVLGGDFLAVD